MALAGGLAAVYRGQIVGAQTSCPIGRQQAARLNGHPPNPLHIILISDRLIISKSPTTSYFNILFLSGPILKGTCFTRLNKAWLVLSMCSTPPPLDFLKRLLRLLCSFVLCLDFSISVHLPFCNHFHNLSALSVRTQPK